MQRIWQHIFVTNDARNDIMNTVVKGYILRSHHNTAVVHVATKNGNTTKKIIVSWRGSIKAKIVPIISNKLLLKNTSLRKNHFCNAPPEFSLNPFNQK